MKGLPPPGSLAYLYRSSRPFLVKAPGLLPEPISVTVHHYLQSSCHVLFTPQLHNEPMTYLSPILPPPQPQITTILFSVSTSFRFYMSEITQYLSFYTCLISLSTRSSRFINVAKNSRISFSKAEWYYNAPLCTNTTFSLACIYQLALRWLPYWVTVNSALMTESSDISTSCYFVSFGSIPSSEFMRPFSLLFWGTSILVFHNGCQQGTRASLPPPPCQQLLSLVLP